VFVLLAACGGASGPEVPDTTYGDVDFGWGTRTGDVDTDSAGADTTPAIVDGEVAQPSDPCEADQTKPCTCENGSTGLQLCGDGEDATCDCETCPGAEPLSPSGFLNTSAVQPLFDHGQVLLTHRAGPPSGGGGCVASVRLTLGGGTPEAPGCTLTLEASGDASPDGALPVTSLRFDADSLCLGMSPSDHGTYTVTELALGEISVTPDNVGGGADAECWTGELTAQLEAIMKREDGHTLTLSKSEIQATGSGLSTGQDVLCPGVDVPVDLNDCEKEVPLFSDCNPYCQLGCDPGEHCVVDAAFFTCHPVGSLPFGAVCSNPAACGPGLSCFALPGSDVPLCHQTCIDDDDCPGDAQCAITANLGGGSELSLCATVHQDCDPLAQTGCEGQDTCYFNGGATLCWPGGSLGAGEVCEGAAPNACAPGLHCLVVCRALCSTGSGTPSCTSCPGEHHEVSPALGLGFCIEGGAPALCDLYEQTGCPEGEGCYPVPGGIACRTSGDIAPGLPCEDGDSCTPGFACVSGGCRMLCDLTVEDAAVTSCPSRCGDSFGAVTPAIWGVGVCVVL
jgi:hypothetical protein